MDKKELDIIVSVKTARRNLNDLVNKGIFNKEGNTTWLRFKLTSVNSGQNGIDMGERRRLRLE